MVAQYMFNPIWNLITLDIGIDLGTANTLVYIKGQGVAMNEPTVVAQHKKQKHVVAVGHKAKEMIGRTPETIKTIRPIASGAIADFEAAQNLIRALLTQVHQEYGQWRRLPKPRVVIGVPARITEVERRAVVDAALAAGARIVYLVDESMASALGSGLLNGDVQGRLLVDIGGGTTEIAVVSLDGLVVNRSVPIAGWEMDQAIINFARDAYQLIIGDQTAEALKIQASQEVTLIMRGRDVVTGLPKAVTISASEVQQAIRPMLDQLRSLVQEVLEETPPELAADITQSGLTLAGGGALLVGIDAYFAETLHMPVQIADQPLDAVVQGTAKLLDNPKMLDQLSLPIRKKGAG
jgi:rod shape-determining protein MreB